MSKKAIVDRIAKETGITKKEAGQAFDATFTGIQALLRRGQRFSVPGFGTFSVGSRKARQGRNPRTGQRIHIPARKVVKFKAGSNLKKAVQ